MLRPTQPTPNRTPPDREIRIVTGLLNVEVRAEGEAPKLAGYAAVFDQWTTLYRGQFWTWREVIRPGAFRNALAEQQDVRALYDHDTGSVLGRLSAGTLRLSEDAKGLAVEIDPPDTQLARDLLVSVSRGDISGMSFGFRVRPKGDRTTITQEGDMEQEDRELLDLDLLEVSIVSFPAYPQTEIAVRALADLRDVPRTRPLTRRNRAERLQRIIEID